VRVCRWPKDGARRPSPGGAETDQRLSHSNRKENKSEELRNRTEEEGEGF
jgi:hypothetical protein